MRAAYCNQVILLEGPPPLPRYLPSSSTVPPDELWDLLQVRVQLNITFSSFVLPDLPPLPLSNHYTLGAVPGPPAKLLPPLFTADVGALPAPGVRRRSRHLTENRSLCFGT